MNITQQSAPSTVHAAGAAPAGSFMEKLHRRYEVIREFRPLKFGIHRDLIALHPEIHPEVVKTAIKWIVREKRYIANVASGSFWYDLDGKESGRITAKDVQLSMCGVRALEDKRVMYA